MTFFRFRSQTTRPPSRIVSPFHGSIRFFVSQERVKKKYRSFCPSHRTNCDLFGAGWCMVIKTQSGFVGHCWLWSLPRAGSARTLHHSHFGTRLVLVDVITRSVHTVVPQCPVLYTRSVHKECTMGDIQWERSQSVKREIEFAADWCRRNQSDGTMLPPVLSLRAVRLILRDRDGFKALIAKK